MTISYFYSDPHFGHRNIIHLCGRPFSDIDEMNEKLVENYNRVVGPDQTVLWVGDAFFLSFKASCEFMQRLNGKKMLILGNHDRAPHRMAEMGFSVVAEQMIVNVGSRSVRVCHYPYRTNAKDHRYHDRHPEFVRGEILIHGHTHSSMKVCGPQIHVGVDAWDFAPVPMGEIEKLVREIDEGRHRKEGHERKTSQQAPEGRTSPS